MDEGKIKKVFKTFKWISAVAAVLSGLFLIAACIAFVPMFFLKDRLTVEAGGLLGFFIEVLREGAAPVSSRDLALLVFPRLAALIFELCLLIKANIAFKNGEKEGRLFFSGSRQLLVSMATTSFLLATIPNLLTNVAKNTVTSPQLFNIVQTERAGWLMLAVVLLFFSFFASKGRLGAKRVSEKNETTKTTEDI